MFLRGKKWKENEESFVIVIEVILLKLVLKPERQNSLQAHLSLKHLIEIGISFQIVLIKINISKILTFNFKYFQFKTMLLN